MSEYTWISTRKKLKCKVFLELYFQPRQANIILISTKQLQKGWAMLGTIKTAAWQEFLSHLTPLRELSPCLRHHFLKYHGYEKQAFEKKKVKYNCN